MTRSLLVLADWLAELGVTRVVMEATSDYWRAPFYLLEAAGFETWLVNAKDVKHLPGRPKTDRAGRGVAVQGRRAADAAAQFRATRSTIRELRDLTRYRIDQVGVRTAEKQRVEKLLEDAGIKLVGGGLGPVRGLRAGDAGRADRRAARPRGAGRAWPAAGCGSSDPSWSRR